MENFEGDGLQGFQGKCWYCGVEQRFLKFSAYQNVQTGLLKYRLVDFNFRVFDLEGEM